MKKSIIIFAILAYASLNQSFALPLPNTQTPSASSLYFRSNSTSWDLNAASSLSPTAYEGVYESFFEIKDQWILGSGIEGVLTETPVKDSWIQGSRVYPLESPTLQAGEGTTLLPPIAQPSGMEGYFTLRFPSLGTYKLVVDTRLKVVSLIAVSSGHEPELGKDSFLYFRSNSTSWSPDEKSILKATGTVGIFETDFEVNEPWMVSTGMSGIFTQTAAENGWGMWSKPWAAVNSVLQAPQATRLREIVDGETEQNLLMRIKFPKLGSYKVVVDWPNKTVAFTYKTPTRGETLWLLLGIGSMDSYGNIFTQAGYRSGTFSRIDPDTGNPLWSAATGSSAISSLYTPWSDGKTILVTTPEKILSYEIATGKLVWSSNLEGEITTGNYFYASIFDDKTLFVNYGENSTKIAAVDRATGKTLWKATKDEYSYLFGFVDSKVFLFQYSPTARLTALDAQTGQPVWVYESTNSYYPLIDTFRNTIFLSGEDSFSRLDTKNGRILWSKFSGNTPTYATNEYGYLTLYKSGPFGSISRLNPLTGETKWSYAYTSEWGGYGTVLSNGSVFVQDGTTYSMVQGEIGTTLWSKTSETYLNFTFDTQQRLFLSNPYWIKRVDPMNGVEVWTHTYDYTHLPDSSYGLDYKGVAWLSACDPNTIFLTYQTSGYGKYAGQGIFSIDAATGILKWDLWDGLPTSILGQSPTKLFYNSYFPYGDSTTKSVLK